MSAVQALARPEILTLKAYSHAAWLPHLVRLHANEAPWRPAGDTTQAGLNRYPEPQPAALVQCLAQEFEVRSEQLLVTRGSDEAIDVLCRLFLRAGQDAILQLSPTFGMYQVAAHIQGAAVLEVPLLRTQDWQLDARRVLQAWRPGVKLVFLCSPNNPTGNRLSEAAILEICAALEGKAVVVVDEAYVEWSGAPSLTRLLSRHPLLAVLRTLSKAHALAGARCGALLANPEIIELARRIIPPYAIAQSTVEAVLRALDPGERPAAERRRRELLEQRHWLRAALAELPGVRQVWPSDSNFLLLDCEQPQRLLELAMAGGFIVRDLRAHPALSQSLRITVGDADHNLRLLRSLAPS